MLSDERSLPDTLAGRLELVRGTVTDAAAEAGRDAAAITTIVVTKFHPVSLVRELHALGVTDVGENRHQDAAPKAAALADLGLTWHFVGQLQSKKARAVLEYSRIIHSADRDSVIRALDSAAGGYAEAFVDSETSPVDVFLQLNLTDDPGRGGALPGALEPLIERVVESPRLRLLGLMAVAPLGVDAREAFAGVRATLARVVAIAPSATALSMGMSADYRAAILEGATHLRIGTAITGNRPQPG